MALTGKTIGQLTFLVEPTSNTLIPVELTGTTYHIAFSAITGNTGTSGSSGSSGTSGTSGSSGSSGTSGSDGSSGSSGTSGSSGSSGTSGSDGSSGSSGSSGTSGSSGSSGTSGSSGSSGTSGLVTLTGNTTNGVITYDGSGTNATVQSGLTYDGTSLVVSGNVTATGGTGSFSALTLNGQSITASGLVNASYLFAVNNANQAGLVANGAVEFQVTQASNGSLINKISNTQVTLTANNTYKLEGIIKRNSSDNTWSNFQWYDVTNGVYIGCAGFGEAVTSSQAGVSSTIVATAYVTPSINTTYEFRSTVNTVTVNQDLASIEITQVNPAIILSAISALTTTGNVTVGGNLEVSGTSSSVMMKASGLVNNGVDVTLGNLKARLAGSGNRSLQVSTVSGTYSVYGSGVYAAGGSGGNTISAAAPVTITTTPAYLAGGLNFTTAGQTDTWIIMDTGNNIAWRISLIVGAAYNNNMVSIERLV